LRNGNAAKYNTRKNLRGRRKLPQIYTRRRKKRASEMGKDNRPSGQARIQEKQQLIVVLIILYL